MKVVVDASVAVKWLFTEEHSQVARQLLAPRIVLHAPDFLLIEAANVIWKKVRRKEISDARPYLDELARMSDAVVLRPSSELVQRAAALGLQLGHPVYDCVYLACAQTESAPLVTADERLNRLVQAENPALDVWSIGQAEVARRISTAATALVIHEDQIREAIAAYEALRETADSVIQKVPKTPSGVRILSPEDQEVAYHTPAYLRLIKLISNLSLDERIDLKALAWYGRQTTAGAPWAYFLNHACRMGADDLDYEAASLGPHWKAGLERLNRSAQDTP